MDGYVVEIKEYHNLVIITDDIIEQVIKKMRKTWSRTMFIDGRRLVSDRYMEYLLTVINGNRDKGGVFEFSDYSRPYLKKADIFKIVGNQLKLMTINREQCFDDVRLIVDDEGSIGYKMDICRAWLV